jgi:hypothetical protein
MDNIDDEINNLEFGMNAQDPNGDINYALLIAKNTQHISFIVDKLKENKELITAQRTILIACIRDIKLLIANQEKQKTILRILAVSNMITFIGLIVLLVSKL